MTGNLTRFYLSMNAPPLAPPMDIGGEYKDDSFYLDTPVKPEYDKRRGTEYDGRERVGEGERGKADI